MSWKCDFPPTWHNKVDMSVLMIDRDGTCVGRHCSAGGGGTYVLPLICLVCVYIPDMYTMQSCRDGVLESPR